MCTSVVSHPQRPQRAGRPKCHRSTPVPGPSRPPRAPRRHTSGQARPPPGPAPPGVPAEAPPPPAPSPHPPPIRRRPGHAGLRPAGPHPARPRPRRDRPGGDAAPPGAAPPGFGPHGGRPPTGGRPEAGPARAGPARRQPGTTRVRRNANLPGTGPLGATWPHRTPTPDRHTAQGRVPSGPAPPGCGTQRSGWDATRRRPSPQAVRPARRPAPDGVRPCRGPPPGRGQSRRAPAVASRHRSRSEPSWV